MHPENINSDILKKQPEHPEAKAIESLMDTLVCTGSVVYRKNERTKTVITDEKKYSVQLIVTETTHISCHEISRQVINHTSTVKILTESTGDNYLR